MIGHYVRHNKFMRACLQNEMSFCFQVFRVVLPLFNPSPWLPLCYFQGLYGSVLFVPLLSRGAIEKVTQVTPYTDVDNVLLEWEVCNFTL